MTRSDAESMKSSHRSTSISEPQMTLQLLTRRFLKLQLSFSASMQNLD